MIAVPVRITVLTFAEPNFPVGPWLGQAAAFGLMAWGLAVLLQGGPGF
jgi:uncharacterized RDD family membrane protein YckC